MLLIFAALALGVSSQSCIQGVNPSVRFECCAARSLRGKNTCCRAGSWAGLRQTSGLNPAPLIEYAQYPGPPLTAETQRHVFIVSDRTGLTAEALAHSLLSQFPGIEFTTQTLSFVDTREKARKVISRCHEIHVRDGHPPLVFITMIDDDIRALFDDVDIDLYDLIATFIGPMEQALGVESSHTVGKSHGVSDTQAYTSRIAAVHFALQTDDGMSTDHYSKAEIIITGVSRCGKTPTSLYLALQYGIFAANYPLTDIELERKSLPDALERNRHKLFALTIDPYRLLQIRQERYAGSRYSATDTCQREVAQAEGIFRAASVPILNTTKMSIEEIGAMILQRTDLQRKL